MLLPEIIAVLGLFLSAAVFYLYARKVNSQKLTLDGFMVANNGLNKSQFSNTFTASSFSLGMTVSWLLVSSKCFGLYVLVSPITYVLGHVVFTWLIKNSKLDIKNCKTISDICYMIYPSKSVARIITGLTLGSYMMILFVELYVATVLLTVFLGDAVTYKALSFFGVGFLALLYVRLGGYSAIVRTDKWQLFLMGLAVSAVFIFGVISPSLNTNNAVDVLRNFTQYTEDTFSMVMFMVWLATINMVYPFAQLVNLQRLTATTNKDASWLGVINGSWKLLALFLLSIFGFLLIHAKGYEMSSISDLLLLVRSGDTFSSYVIFPLIIIGFASMVFSSTDIAIIAMGYALSDSNTFMEKFSGMSEQRLRKILTLFTVSVLLMLTMIYWLQFAGLQDWLIPLIYTASGQLAILTPIPIYAVIKLRKQEKFHPVVVNRRNTFILFNSVMLAWALLFVGAYLSKTTGDQFWSLTSMPIGGIMVFFAILYCSKYKYDHLPAYKFRIVSGENKDYARK